MAFDFRFCTFFCGTMVQAIVLLLFLDGQLGFLLVKPFGKLRRAAPSKLQRFFGIGLSEETHIRARLNGTTKQPHNALPYSCPFFMARVVKHTKKMEPKKGSIRERVLA